MCAIYLNEARCEALRLAGVLLRAAFQAERLSRRAIDPWLKATEAVRVPRS